MDIDALLELLGIKPQKAEGATVGSDVGAQGSGNGNNLMRTTGVYPQPISERMNNRAQYMDRVNAPQNQPPSDLMSIVQRNQNATGPTQSPNPAFDPTAASIDNSHARGQQMLSSEQSSIAQEQQRLAELEAQMAQAAEQRQRQVAMTPEMATPGPTPAPRPYINASAGANIQEPYPIPPGPVANPFPPQAPTVGSDMGVFVGQRGATEPPRPVWETGAPQATNPAAVDPTLNNYNPIINGGPFMTMPPPDPFMDQSPTAGPTPVPIPHPGPTPNYTLPNNRNYRNPGYPFPFIEPSAATRLTMPAAEGGSLLDRPPAVPQQPNNSPFAPEGEIINWWNSGQGRSQPAPTAQRPQPTTAGLRRVAPTPTPGPDQSTLLNQAELQRFLAANPGGSAPPPTPATTPPTPLASVPPTPAAPVTPGASSMSPPAPPSAGAQIPPALREQLLTEAYRLVAQRNNPNQGAPAR